LNIVVPTWVDEVIVGPIVSVPFLFWFLNMMWLALVSVFLMKFMKYLASLGEGFLSLRVKVDRKVNKEALMRFLATRSVKVSETVSEGGIKLKKQMWNETDDELWQGAAPAIEVFFDATNGFLLSVYFQIDTKKTPLREKALMALFDVLLKKHGVYTKFDPEVEKYSKRMSVAVVDPDEKAAFTEAARMVAQEVAAAGEKKGKAKAGDSDSD